MVFSQWEDKSIGSDLNDLIDKFIKSSKHIVDKFDNSNLSEVRNKLFDENQVVQLTNCTVTYNCIEYSYEFIKRGRENEADRDKRVGEYSAKIIVFEKSGCLYYIIDKSYSNKTLTNLRRMMDYSGKNEIIEHRFSGLKPDIFIWSLYRLLRHTDDSIDDIGKMKLENLVGFSGETEDKLATISGSGRRVINLLTTLLFLFENKSISKVELTINFTNEKFKISMGENSFIDVDIDACLINNIVAMDEQVNSEILLKTFIDVLPIFIKSFSNHQDRKQWTERIKKKFFKDLGRDITTEVKRLSKQI